MNKYEKLCTVGEGAYGVVLKCEHKDTGELVAIKKFKERDDDDEQNRKASLREVKILRALRHENIVEMKEAFRRRGTLYLVFEFVDRSVLDLLEARPSGLEPETVRTLIYQLARALDHCHRHNVIHRDIKPENLLVSDADHALRLCDFGCARRLDSKSPLTDYVATRWYRPPELLLSASDYGTSVDLWALGCIAGEIFDGRPLFAGESDVDQLLVIQRMMGALTAEQTKLRMENSCFCNVQFPDSQPPQTLERRYSSPSMPLAQMELMKGVLLMEPSDRVTAKAVVKMPWFKGIVLPASLAQRRDLVNAEPPCDGPAPAQKGGHKKAAEAAARALETELALSDPKPLEARDASRMSSWASAPVIGDGKENQLPSPLAGKPKLPLPLGPSSKASEKVSGGLPSVSALAGMDSAALSFGPPSGKSTKHGWLEDSLPRDAKKGHKPPPYRKDDPPSGRQRRAGDEEGAKAKKGQAAQANPYRLPWEATAGSDDVDELFAELGGEQPAMKATGGFAAFGSTGGFGAFGATGGFGKAKPGNTMGEGAPDAAPRALGAPPPGAANAAAKLCLNGDRRSKRWGGGF